MIVRSLAAFALSAALGTWLTVASVAEAQQENPFPAATFAAAKIPTYPKAIFFNAYIDTLVPHTKKSKAEFISHDSLKTVTAWYRAHLGSNFKLGTTQTVLSTPNDFVAGGSAVAAQSEVILQTTNFPGQGRVTDIILSTPIK